MGCLYLICFSNAWATSLERKETEEEGHGWYIAVAADEGGTHTRVRHRGMLRLSQPPGSEANLYGLSALAWVASEGNLYAMSDSAQVFVFKPLFMQNELTGLEFIRQFSLKDGSGKPLRGSAADSEALFWQAAKSQVAESLFVGFERQPRIERYDLRGNRLESLTMPKGFERIQAYAQKNKSIEALSSHPKFAYVAGTEWPMKQAQSYISLFTPLGAPWRYYLFAEPKCGLTALEHWHDDIFVSIERCFLNIAKPFTILLRRVQLNIDDSNAAIQDLAVWRSNEVALLDNFEGLAHHRDNFFFIISDDNRNPWQNTLLSYIEIQ